MFSFHFFALFDSLINPIELFYMFFCKLIHIIASPILLQRLKSILTASCRVGAQGITLHEPAGVGVVGAAGNGT